MAFKSPRVVFDTNVFISAILFGGVPREILELAREGKIQLVTSREILLELSKKLHEKFEWGQEEVEELIQGIGVFAEVVIPGVKIVKIKADPSDNRILECAKEAKADFIISGDKRHILPLKKFGDAKIVTPREFMVKVS